MPLKLADKVTVTCPEIKAVQDALRPFGIEPTFVVDSRDYTEGWHNCLVRGSRVIKVGVAFEIREDF